MELFYGAYKAKQVAANLAKAKTLENELPVLVVGQQVAEVFGMLKADLENKGTPLDDFDLVLASSALAHNSALVTNNLKYFKRIDGLKLANWAEPEQMLAIGYRMRGASTLLKCSYDDSNVPEEFRFRLDNLPA